MEETVFASYNRSPVREAIFSVRFQSPLSVERVRSFCANKWATQYYAPAEANPAGQQPGPLGYVLFNADRSALLRLTTTQLHYHRLGIYPGWEIASAAFLDAWTQLTQAVPALVSQEASIRYINKITWEIPLGGKIELSDYLTLLPNLPAGFPGLPGPFFLQVQILDALQGLHGIVTEVMEFPSGPSARIEVVLDIEVSHHGSAHHGFAADAASFNVLHFLRAGRVFKNNLFERCITPATRALFA